MKIAITAVSGALGEQIAKAVLAEHPSQNVVGLARTMSKAKHLGIELRPGDYNDKVALQSSLSGVDSLLLVSGMDAPEKRIEQHRNVIEAAKLAGVKKIVYTSVQGANEGNAFSPVIKSNRQTEQDLVGSGLEWVIGRNGIYIEPDVEYIETYKQLGFVSNCAADGLCGYTTRAELGFAYAKLLSQDKHNGQIYNLHGQTITQSQLVTYLNQCFGIQLKYVPLSVEEYQQQRISELGEFIGSVIAGIYQGIRDGNANHRSDYLRAAGREHQSWNDYFEALKLSLN